MGTGSTTGECWRTYTQDWFKENFPDAEITETYAAIGGTDTVLAITRLNEELIQYKPDLVFIEFSLNDSYTYRSYTQSAVLLEGMIRTINKALPNTDIIVVTTVDKNSINNPTENAKAHKDVALYNGITYLNMTEPLKNAMESTGNDWDYYITDYAHPNETGYRVYSDYITEKIGEMLKDSATREPALKAVYLPDKTYASNPITKNEIIYAEDLQYDSEMWTSGHYMKRDITVSDGTLKAIRGKRGATIELAVQGSTVILVGDFYKGAKVKCQIDGGNTQNIGVTDDDSGAVLLYDNLNPDLKHTLTITVEGSGLCDIAKVFVG